MKLRLFLLVLLPCLILACGEEDNRVSLDAPPAPIRETVPPPTRIVVDSDPNAGQPSAPPVISRNNATTTTTVLTAAINPFSENGTGVLQQAQWLPNGQNLLISTSRETFAVDLDTQTRTPIESPPFSNILSPDGRLALGWSEEGGYALWEVASQTLLYLLETPADYPDGQLLEWQFSADGREIAAFIGQAIEVFPEFFTTQREALVRWSTDTGALIDVWQPADRQPLAFRYDNQGRLLVVSLVGNGFRLENALTSTVIFESDDPAQSFSGGVFISPTGQWMAYTSGRNNNLHIIELPSGATPAWAADIPSVAFANFYLSRDRSHVGVVAFGQNGQAEGAVIYTVDGQRVQTLTPVTEAPTTNSRSFFGNSFTTLSFSPDNRAVLGITTSGSVNVFDLNSGELLLNLADFERRIAGVAISNDGTQAYLARVGSGSPVIIEIWDIESQTLVGQFSERNYEWNQNAMLSTGTYLLTVGSTARVWDIAGQKIQKELTGSSGWDSLTSSADIVYHPATDQFIALGENSFRRGGEVEPIAIWGTVEGGTYGAFDEFPEGESVTAAAFSIDGARVVLGGALGQLYFVDTANGALLLTIDTENGGVKGLAVSPDDARLFVAGQDGALQVRSTTDGELVETLRLPDYPDLPMAALYLSPDGKTLLSASRDTAGPTIFGVWDVESLDLLATYPFDGQFSDLAFFPDGTRFLTGGQDGLWRIWELTFSAQTVPITESTPTDEAESAGDTGAALPESLPAPDLVPLWDINGAVVSGIGGLTQLDTVWISASDGIWLLDVNTLDLTPLPHAQFPVALGPQGNRVAAWRSDVPNTIGIWQIDGTLRNAWEVPLNGDTFVSAMAFSPDESILAIQTANNAVTLYAAEDGRLIETVSLDAWAVAAVGYDTQGHLLIAASTDREVGTHLVEYGLAVWDADTDTEVFRLPTETSVRDITFSADGRWVTFFVGTRFYLEGAGGFIENMERIVYDTTSWQEIEKNLRDARTGSPIAFNGALTYAMGDQLEGVVARVRPLSDDTNTDEIIARLSADVRGLTFAAAGEKLVVWHSYFIDVFDLTAAVPDDRSRLIAPSLATMAQFNAPLQSALWNGDNIIAGYADSQVVTWVAGNPEAFALDEIRFSSPLGLFGFSGVQQLHLSADGTRLYLLLDQLYVWDMVGNALLGSVRGAAGFDWLIGLAASADHTRLALLGSYFQGSSDKVMLRGWDLTADRPAYRDVMLLSQDEDETLSAHALTADGTLGVIGITSGRLVWLDLVNGEITGESSTNGRAPTALTWNADHSAVWAAMESEIQAIPVNGTAPTLTLSTPWSLTQHLTQHNTTLYGVGRRADDAWYLGAWDTTSGAMLWELPLPFSAVPMPFRIVDLSGALIGVMTQGHVNIVALEVNADGQILLAASNGEILVLGDDPNADLTP